MKMKEQDELLKEALLADELMDELLCAVSVMDLLDVIKRYHYFGMKDVVIEYLSREEQGATTEWRGQIAPMSL